MILKEDFPYRYAIVGTIELNGKPDCRIQEYNIKTKRCVTPISVTMRCN